jgi:hypothetical protein
VTAPPSAEPTLLEETRRLVLRAPARVHVAGALAGALGALFPYVTSGLVVPWQATPLAFATSVGLALLGHGILHAVFSSSEEPEPWARFAGRKLLPGLVVAFVVAIVFGVAPELRACAYAAFVVNGAASVGDLWIAVELARWKPEQVQDVAGQLECELRRAST